MLVILFIYFISSTLVSLVRVLNQNAEFELIAQDFDFPPNMKKNEVTNVGLAVGSQTTGVVKVHSDKVARGRGYACKILH